MKKTLLCVLFVLTMCLGVRAQHSNPLVFGNNRITIITPTLFRLEYALNGKFLDNPTMFAIDRSATLQDFKVEALGQEHYKITTAALTMYYHHDDFPFGLHNFHVIYDFDGKQARFTNRGRQSKNLGGAVSTLDRVNGEIPLDEGLLSRDGWYIINDTGKDILVDDWLQLRDKDHVQDQYCFVYGSDYKAALLSLGTISGHVPMTRKYVHGAWYCRYWDYTSKDYIDIVDGYKKHDFPIDNVVFDMGWHTYDAKVGTGHSNNRSWTGYTWNKKLIADPQALIRKFKEDKIYVSLNDHPHDGIRPNESMYGAFMHDMGFDSLGGKSLLFDAADRKYMTNFLKHAHGESMDMGVAFWWLDWQQNYLYPQVRGTQTSHLTWLNKLYFDESKQRGERGAGYSRWAGWGDHRHPIQFSGDAFASWQTLAFEVKLSATSSNSGCYYWAHDVGGFYEGYDPELYARWTQFGAVSAALRIHSYQDPKLDRRPWLWGDQATVSMRKSYHLRSQLMPYVYTSVNTTHRTMIPLIRAMYIDYGSDERAYNNPQQFMFGDLLLAAPITSAGRGEQKVASQKVWFPNGATWYDIFDNKAYAGGTECSVAKTIDEFPLFVKGGYMLPMQPYTARPASTPLTTLILRAYPGQDGDDNAFCLYEDDGVSREYESGKSATTILRYQRMGNTLTLTIEPTIGNYSGMVCERGYRFELPAIGAVKSAKVGGRKVSPVFDTAINGYVVTVPARPIDRATQLVVEMQ